MVTILVDDSLLRPLFVLWRGPRMLWVSISAYFLVEASQGLGLLPFPQNHLPWIHATVSWVNWGLKASGRQACNSESTERSVPSWIRCTFPSGESEETAYPTSDFFFKSTHLWCLFNLFLSLVALAVYLE